MGQDIKNCMYVVVTFFQSFEFWRQLYEDSTILSDSKWYFSEIRGLSMLDEMAKFEAFYQVISSSKKPLISEYIVLIVGL